MPHIIPSIFKTVLIIQYLLSSGNTAKRKRAGLYSWGFDEKFEITYPIGVSKI